MNRKRIAAVGGIAAAVCLVVGAAKGHQIRLRSMSLQ